jgi:putative flippase GtrA
MVLARYLTVGLACMLLHIAIMIAGDAVGLHYVVSSIVSLVIVTAFGYGLHSSWTYPQAERGGASFTRYLLIVGSNFPLSLAGLFVFVDLLGVSVPIAAPVVTVILVGFNYVASRWVFRGGRRSA